MTVAVGALFAVASAPATAVPVALQTFTWDTPGTYSWVVPESIDKVRVDMYGGQGGGTTAYGTPGLGGEAAGTIYVTPGETIQVNVGGAGGFGTVGYNGGGAGGYDGGGSPSRGGGGGGASDIRFDSDGMGGYTLDERVLVAGGGGGRGESGGQQNYGDGGAGGGDQGRDGSTNGFRPEDYGGWGGRGGTQTGGGAGGSNPVHADPAVDGQDGQAGTGGAGMPQGSCIGCAGGGGGGGGYYGGGGGARGRGDATDYGMAGGGGGSGYGPPGTILTAGQNTGNGSVTITEDLSPPDKPMLSGSDPASPSKSDTPKIKGSAEFGATIKLYTDSACTGPVAAQGSESTFNSTGLTLNQPVAHDRSTTFYATATDHFATSSACSDGFTYVEDQTPPDKPSLTTTVPASPGNDDTPQVKGSAETGSSVKLYDTSACSGTPIGSGSAADLAGSGIEVPVRDDQTTHIYASATDAAGNTSECSDALAYVEDQTPPATPDITATDPPDVGNDDTPNVIGSAEAGSTVRIYTDSTCSGSVAGSGSAADYAGSGVTASVPDNTTTSLYANATDAAGNVSPCSRRLVYTEDSVPPAEPTVSSVDPVGPANNNSPTVYGSYDGDDQANTFLYLTPDCSGQAVGSDPSYQFASGGMTATVPDDQSVTIYAQEVDQAGNASDCSNGIAYTEDSTPPAKPVFSGSTPASPSFDQTPKLKGTAEAASTVRLYTNATCTTAAQIGGSAVQGSAQNFASGLQVAADRNATSHFYAEATDAAGNVSDCSDAFAYTHDDVAPAKPAALATTPGSPSKDKAPKVTGTAESGSTVSLYLSADCSGNVAGHGSAADFASPGIDVTVPADASTSISALTTDAAGNASACSSVITYVEDSTAPVPTLDAPADGSTTADTTPTFSGAGGTATRDSSTVTVEVYAGNSVAGTPVATLTATRDAVSGAYSVDAAAALADGTYTARPVQTDSVGNSGSGVAHKFTVATPKPAAPDDQNTPTVPQNTSPQQQQHTTPMKVTISHRNVPLVGGHVEVVLKCTGTAASACAGTLTLTPTGDTTRLRTATAGRATFRIAAGTTKTIKLTPTARLMKLLRRHRKVVAIIGIHPGGAGAAAATTRRVTVVAQRHSA